MFASLPRVSLLEIEESLTPYHQEEWERAEIIRCKGSTPHYLLRRWHRFGEERLGIGDVHCFQDDSPFVPLHLKASCIDGRFPS